MLAPLPEKKLLIDAIKKDTDGETKWICYHLYKWSAVRAGLANFATKAFDWFTVGFAGFTVLVYVQPGINYHTTEWFQSIEWLKAPPEAIATEPDMEEFITTNAVFPIANMTIDTAPISSGFGWRRIFGRQDFHEGVDIPVEGGTPVQAVSAGEVAEVKQIVDQYQIKVISEDKEEFYIHIQNPSVQVGDRIEAGQKIGEVATTSQAAKTAQLSTGDHLDFRVRIDGKWTDPKEYLSRTQAMEDPDKEIEARALFNEVCFGAEYGGSGQRNRWTTPIRFAIAGEPTQFMMDKTNEVMEGFNELGYDVAIAQEATATIHFIPKEQFSTLIPSVPEGAIAFVYLPNQGIESTQILIPTNPELTQQEVGHLILEEITQGVSGCLVDTEKHLDSVFNQQNFSTQQWSELDKKVLAIAAQE